MNKMIKVFQNLKTIGQKAGLFLILLSHAAPGQNTYTFTNASATGSLGPTQAQINLSYASTNLNGLVASNNGIQSFTVPVTGPYKITVSGAQGAGNGGLGAQMEGDFTLTAGQVLNIVVGQQGENGTGGNSNNNGGGGGGGSFVVSGTNSLLIVAGGGGGGLTAAAGANGLTGSIGGSTYFDGAGDNGSGGHSGLTNGDAAGGGGFLTDGQNSFNTAQNVCQGGKSFLNGATGGQSGMNGSYYGGAGGFGGGGSGWHNSINRCGGGGGYSGGQGGTLNSSPACFGGGGGSFNSGSNQLSLAGVKAGNGVVVIRYLYKAIIAQTSNILCNGSSNASLSSTITGGTAPYTYTWLPNGGNSATASNLSAGTYTLMVKDNNALITSKTYTITQPEPVVISTSVSNQTVCNGNSVTLNAFGANTYTWSNGVSNGVSFVPDNSGSYNVTGTNNEGCIGTATINITVNALPVLTLSASEYTSCSKNPIVLTGLPSGGIYSGENVNDTIFTAYSNGVYNPAYSFTNSSTGCSNSVSTTLRIETCTGVEANNNFAAKIKLFPNPCKGNFQIETNNTDVKMIRISDVSGRTVLTDTYSGTNINIDITHFSNGMYYVSLKSENETAVLKLMKS